MKVTTLIVCMLAVATVAVAGVPAIPDTPAGVDDVLYARTFEMEKGYNFEWTKDRSMMTTGTLLVLKVNPDLVFARQVAEPVLYVGNKTAERVNIGHKSGHVIAIVPGEVDLKTTPIYFGTPELPERVDAEMADSELASAQSKGIKPFAAKKVEAAQANGGEKLQVADREELLREIAPLIVKYAADEKPLADAFLVPVTPSASKASD